MLSDTCFEVVEELLDAITRYDYSDDFMSKLITAIMELNEIRDELDHAYPEEHKEKLLKNNKAESFRITREKIAEAKEKRNN